MRLSRLALVVLLISVASCGDDPAPVTTPSVPVYVTELFNGSLTSGGTTFYSFTLTDAGTISVMLATTTTATGTPVSRELTVGLGVPQGTACGVTTSVNTTAALNSQITSNNQPASTYCVNLSDPGTLTSTDAVTFNVRINHP